MNAPGRRIRPAGASDLPAVEPLLSEYGLPLHGLADLLEGGLVVAEAPDGLLGCAALGVHGRSAVLRSVAVRRDRQGHGVGEALVLDRVQHARRLGLEAIHLLTLDAAEWFARFGFRPIAREDVPAELRSTWMFSDHAPAGVHVMALPLTSPVTFILVRSQFAGNLGMICRAATAFGFPDVRLVRPALDLAKPEGRWFAHGAEETLDRVQVFDSLDKALHDCFRAVATTARRRHWNRAMHEPADLADVFRDATETRKLAIVLGPEDHGLTNDEVARCESVISIPRPLAMGATLSLPAAATIVAWEIAKARGAELRTPPGRQLAAARAKHLLSSEELDRFVDSVASSMEGIGLRPQPDAARFRGTLRDFFGRARPTEADRVFLRHLLAQLGKWKRSVLEAVSRDRSDAL